MLIVNADDLPRLMQCIGSRNMAAVLPPDFNKEARDEGTAAHAMAVHAFNGVAWQNLIDHKAANGFVMTDEMADHVSEFLDAIDCGEMEAVTSFSGDDWEIHGRCDHRKVRNDTLTIDDFKYGWRIVEPDENWTLIAHAIGTCIALQITPATIILRIHQPRPHHPNGKVREWRISYNELMDFYRRIVERLSHPTEELNTGNACFKCHAYHTCPAAALMEANAIDVAYDTAFNDELPPEILASELDTLRYAKDVVEARLNALEELATHKLKTGIVIPEYTLERRFANTRWKPGITPGALTMTTGIDCSKPGLITPAEAKRRKVPEHVVKMLTDRPVIGTKLTRSNVNKRAEKLLNRSN